MISMGLRLGFSGVHVLIRLLVGLLAFGFGIRIRTEFLNSFAEADRIRSGHFVLQPRSGGKGHHCREWSIKEPHETQRARAERVQQDRSKGSA